MGEKIPLGKSYAAAIGMSVARGKLSDEERLSVLEQQVAYMTTIITALRVRLKKGSPRVKVPKQPEEDFPAPFGKNKDGLPIGLVCIGETEKNTFPLCMTVSAEGYVLGMKTYPSVSAAAEAVSFVRRSGWAFWKVPDGRTLKEVFKKE
jgi:hypothetical protein